MKTEVRAKIVTELENLRDRFGRDAFDLGVWDLWCELYEDKSSVQRRLRDLQTETLSLIYGDPE